MHLPLNHDYAVIGWANVTVSDVDFGYKRTETRFELVCTKCGKVKDKRISKRPLDPYTATQIAKIKYGLRVIC